MIYAGSISFLYGIKGIPILYNLYIRHQEITAPFKFVSEATITKFSVPVLERMIGSAWGPLAFSLIIAIIYFYFYIISKKASKMTFLLCGLLLAFLALVAETYFAAFCLILLIYPFAFGFIKKDWKGGKDLLFTSFLLLIIAAPIAFLQGGVLKGVFTVTLSYIPGLADIGGFLKVNETSWAVDYFEGQVIYYSQFLMEWVLLVVVLIPAFIFLFKRNFNLASFLGVFVVISFLIPIFISTDNFAYIAEKFHFFVRIGALWRFFYLVNLIGGLAAGLFLAHLYLSSKKIWLKRLALFIIIALMAQGLLFQLWYLSIAYPPFIWNTVAPHYAEPGSFEEKSYDWVRDNTTINDLFLIIGRYCNNSDNPVTNYKFILNTGRMAPTYIYNCGYPLNDSFKRIKEDCDASAVKDLQYRYLYVDQNWPEGLEEKCLANNNLELKFGGGEGNEFIRIYKNLALPES
ncbi:MAG: hypothetical protein Q8P10_03085 [bacterium]|nr:hypothetical protein [bacterium]